MKNVIIYFFTIILIISCNFITPEEYLHRAESAAEQGKYRDAIKLANKAISMNTKFTDAYINRGIYYSILGDEKKSLNDFKNAASLDSKNTLALYNIALIYNNLKNYTMALEFCNKTFESKGRGIGCYIDTNDNAFGNSGKKDVASHIIYFERAKANYNLSKFQEAKNDFLMCIDDNYKNVECYYWIANAYLKIGNVKLACENFNMAKLLGNRNVQENEIKMYCK